MARKHLLTALAIVLLAAPAANAVAPALQIYIEGATYDTGLESWVTTSGSFKLWVLSDVDHWGDIADVKLAASMYGTSGSISISPTTTSLVTDPSTSGSLIDLGSDESQFEAGGVNYTPSFDRGVNTHAEYADADYHHFWRIGDFTLMDSPISNYGDASDGDVGLGQINAYDVVITGWDMVHWDAFDHSVETDHHGDPKFWYKAPFSHDGTGGGVIPEPGTFALLGLGLAGLGARLRRKS